MICLRRRKIILFMTVGTGINFDSDEAGFNSLAEKLYSTIHKIHPNFIVFFASNKSKYTIDCIGDLFKRDNDEFIPDEDYQIVPLEAIDDFNTCFETFETEIVNFDFVYDDDFSIIMDYTSGTKTMSAAMACCGMFYNKDLICVGGDRTTGEVFPGTEIINYQNLYKIYDRFAFMRIRSNFNANRFMQCIDILKHVVDFSVGKEHYLSLCRAYYYWDNMDFENAYKYFLKVDMNSLALFDIKDKLKQNLRALGNIVNSRSQNLKNCYILASLINNSKRRAEEYKYDDAIARLYRSFELIAQVRLGKYDIDSSDVDVGILKKNNVSDEFIETLEKIREDGKIRIGLSRDFLLLNELDDDLGKYYIENEKRIKSLTLKRNNSILAHGLDSSSSNDFDEFLEVVVSLALKLDKDMNKFLRETEFAKYDLKLELNRA